MANKNIKGITIEIGGDTTGLSKALGDVDKKTRNLQSELKNVERLLKFDPTNTELLVQKQKLLSESVDSVKERLSALKEAESQVQEQFEHGDIGEEQYRAFRQELIQTEQQLSGISSELHDATRNLNEFGDNNGVAKESTERLNKEVENEKKVLNDAEQAQREHSDAVEEAKEELAGQTEKLKGLGEAAAAGITAMGAAAVAAGGYAINFSDEYDRALNKLINQTGAAKDEIDGFDEILNNLYFNDSMGDDIADVATSISAVKQQTGLTGKDLESATYNAILFRDALDMDVGESAAGAAALMKQFGIKSDEAFNIIAQGAQNGLNKNGDLMDLINEFSGDFANLGLTTEDMFNMLSSGADSGAYDVNMLGDAMNEFGIRAKDNSDTTKQAFVDLGFDADNLTLAFAKGGEESGKAFKDIVKALSEVKDPVSQNTTGVALFGSMWEDMGGKAILAMADTQKSISATKNALEDIDNTQYNDLGSEISGLKRTLEGEIIKPLGDKLKPKVEEIAQYIKNNSPKIKKSIQAIVDKVAELIKWIIDNKDAVITAITGIATMLVMKGVAKNIMGLTGAFKTCKFVVEGLATAMAANPIGAAITAVGILTLGMVELARVTAQDSDYIKEQKAEHEQLIGKITEENTAWADLKAEKEKQIDKDMTAIGKTKSLWEELQTLADSTGKVKDADKDRAAFIVGELNKSLDTEYTMTGNQISKYQDMRGEINKLILAKKAQIIMDAGEEQYKTALLEVNDKLQEQSELAVDIAKQENEVKSLKGSKAYAETEQGKKSIKALESMISEKKALYKDNENVVNDHYSTISQYESNAADMAAGNYYKITSSVNDYSKNLKSATEANDNELKQQILTTGMNYAQLQEKVNNGTEGVTQKMVDEAHNAYNRAITEWERAGNTIPDGIKNGINMNAPNANEATFMFSEGLKTVMDSSAGFDAYHTESSWALSYGNGISNSTATGIRNGIGKIGSAALEASMKAIEPLPSAAEQAITSGENIGYSLATGIRNSIGEIGAAALEASMKATEFIQSTFSGLTYSSKIETDNVWGAASRIPKFAKGGKLVNGDGIVAEAGPELITMMNGVATITPLTGSAKNTNVSSGIINPTSNNNQNGFSGNVVIPVYLSDREIGRASARFENGQQIKSNRR